MGDGRDTGGERTRMYYYAAVDRDPSDAQAWLLLVESFRDSGRPVAALLVARQGIAAIEKAAVKNAYVDRLAALRDTLASDRNTAIDAAALSHRDLATVTPTSFTAEYFGTAARGGFRRRQSVDAGGTIRNNMLVWLALDEHGIRLPVTPTITVSENFLISKPATPDPRGLPRITSNGVTSRHETITVTEPRSGAVEKVLITVSGLVTQMAIDVVHEVPAYRIGDPAHLVPRTKDDSDNHVFIERLNWSARRVENEHGAPCDEDATKQLARDMSWVHPKFFWESHHNHLNAPKPEQAGLYEVAVTGDGTMGIVMIRFTTDAAPLDVPVFEDGIQWVGDSLAAMERARRDNTWIMAFCEAQW
jgi:hypothetical protein